MGSRREIAAFCLVLAAMVVFLLHESLLLGRVLSPADVVYTQSAFAASRELGYEPANRLLMDPVLQFEPWLEFTRAELRKGRLPLWNPHVGFGAPHLANGQSAVFDPFHLPAYLGPLPQAHGWMAAARLWTAGLGMFLLARAWGLGTWGRWFAGLTFPLSGFLVAWLLYPPASVAVWLPWLLLASDSALRRPGPGTLAGLSVATTLVLLGGHIQTSAHVLLASAVVGAWRWLSDRPTGLRCWFAGIALGLTTGSIAYVPLAVYLTRSPVWSDRQAERGSVLEIEKPRLLDAVCTAFPYLYGSQRRGHPHLARPLGVHNLNESAGGFAGLATLLWLAPLAVWTDRRSWPVGPVALLAVVGGLAAFGIPPVSNLIRAVPVLDVIDERRLTLWMAFGLCLLGGVGLDALPRTSTLRRWTLWIGFWGASAAVLLGGAVIVRLVGPELEPKVLEHYLAAIAADELNGAEKARVLAARQIENLIGFLPAYLALGAAHLSLLSGLALALRFGRIGPTAARSAVMGLTMMDLLGFSLGLNPAIQTDDYRPRSELIEYLVRHAPPPARILPLGAELPPNILMRYGLNDCRNYDSVELTSHLEWLETLFEPDERPARTSRRDALWSGVGRSIDRLRDSGVVVVVSASPPPEGLRGLDRIEQVGACWVAHLGTSDVPGVILNSGVIELELIADAPRRHPLAVSYDPGWRAWIDGRPVQPKVHDETFLAVDLPAGSHNVCLRYEPTEVKAALALSTSGLVATLVLAGYAFGSRNHPGKTGHRSWSASPHPVTIDFLTSSRSSHPAEHRRT